MMKITCFVIYYLRLRLHHSFVKRGTRGAIPLMHALYFNVGWMLEEWGCRCCAIL